MYENCRKLESVKVKEAKPTKQIKTQIIRDNKRGIRRIAKYNKDGNEIYSKEGNIEIFTEYYTEGYLKGKKKSYRSHMPGFDDFTESYQYDDNGNLIRITNSRGEEAIYKYDENNHPIYSKDPDGDITEFKYDKYGNVIYKNDNGNITEFKYDEYGNVVYKNDNGVITEYKYDEYGNNIYFKGSSGREYFTEIEYYEEEE